MGPKLPGYVGQNFGSCAMYSDYYDIFDGDRIWYITNGRAPKHPGQERKAVMIRFDVFYETAEQWPYMEDYDIEERYPRRHMGCGVSSVKKYLEYGYSLEFFEIEGGIR